MHAVQHARDPVGDGGAAGRLDPDQPRPGVDESGERAGRIRPPADAGHDDIGVGAVEDRPALTTRLVADHALELAHHVREGMRAHDRPRQ